MRKRKKGWPQTVDKYLKSTTQQLCLTELPDDILWEIFFQLDSPSELLKLSHTCKRLQNLIEIYIPNLITHPRFDSRVQLETARAHIHWTNSLWQKVLDKFLSDDLSDRLKILGRHSFISRYFSFIEKKLYLLPYFAFSYGLDFVKCLVVHSGLASQQIAIPVMLAGAGMLSGPRLIYLQLIKQALGWIASRGESDLRMDSYLLNIWGLAGTIPLACLMIYEHIDMHPSFQRKALRLAKLSRFKEQAAKHDTEIPSYIVQYELENADPDYHVKLLKNLLRLENEHNKNVDNILASKPLSDLRKVKSTFFAGYFAAKNYMSKAVAYQPTSIRSIAVHPSL